MRLVRKHLGALTFFPILFVSTLGCLGPGSSENNCVATVTDGDKTFVGSAAKQERAELNACNKFCLETDSKFDGMYQIWVNSPAGKDFTERRKRKPTKNDAIMEDDRLLDYITNNCANRCYREANKGKHKLEVKCKK